MNHVLAANHLCERLSGTALITKRCFTGMFWAGQSVATSGLGLTVVQGLVQFVTTSPDSNPSGA